MILIVDFNEQRSAAIYDTIRWTDGRLRLQIANNRHDGWSFVVRHKPAMVICGDLNGDTADFISQCRKNLPHAMLLLCGDEDNRTLSRKYDGFLETPPSRIAIFSFLQTLKKKRVIAKEAAALNESRRRSYHADSNEYAMSVTVGITSNEGELNFRVPATPGMRLESLLQQIGKHSARCHSLVRQGQRIEAASDTVLQNGDSISLDHGNETQI